MPLIITLAKTHLGYSIIQDGKQITKISSNAIKKQRPSNPKKLGNQNFTIYPYLKQITPQIQNTLVMSLKAKWFSFNSVHQIEKKALPEWFKVRKGILATMNYVKFEKNEQMYRLYRNHIITLGADKYISPYEARKGLAGDACAIIRIHSFLESWGLINYLRKKDNRNKQISAQQKTSKINGENQQAEGVKSSKQLSYREQRDCLDFDKQLLSKSFYKDEIELLKKISRNFRPKCSFCNGLCGVIWFESNFDYKITKDITSDQEHKINQNGITGKEIYDMRVCVSCMEQDNIPVIFTIKDFHQVSLLEGLQQRKKNNLAGKIVDAVEKNRFNLEKTSKQLKIYKNELFEILMRIPVQKLQKMSRIEPDTEVEEQEEILKKQLKDLFSTDSVAESKAVRQNSEERQKAETVEKVKIINSNLPEQGEEAYTAFIQSYLQMIQKKVNILQHWGQSVLWRSNEYQSNLKKELGESLKKRLKELK